MFLVAGTLLAAKSAGPEAMGLTLFKMGFLGHCVKSVQTLKYFLSVFSCIGIKYGHLRSKSPYSIRMQKNTFFTQRGLLTDGGQKGPPP